MVVAESAEKQNHMDFVVLQPGHVRTNHEKHETHERQMRIGYIRCLVHLGPRASFFVWFVYFVVPISWICHDREFVLLYVGVATCRSACDLRRGASFGDTAPDSTDYQTKHGSGKCTGQEEYLAAFERRNEDERHRESHQKPDSAVIRYRVWSRGT